METRTCSRCGQEKAREAFLRPRASDGLASFCDACRHELGRDKGRGYQGGEGQYVDRALTTAHIRDKWLTYARRLERSVISGEASEYARGQHAVAQEIARDVEQVTRWLSQAPPPPRRRKLCILPGQLSLW